MNRNLLPNHKSLFKNFIKLMAAMFAIILSITFFIYRNSNQIIRQELLQANINTTQNIADSIDNLLMEMRYITATLATNKMVQFYFASHNPEMVFDGFYDRINDQLTSYIHSFDFIHSIYLYSTKEDTYIDVYGKHPLFTLTDTSWIPELDLMTENIHIVSRKINHVYPFVVTIINRVQINDVQGYIVININLHKIPNMLDSRQKENQEIYIVTNAEQILFHKKQEDILEPISTVPVLDHFHALEKEYSTLVLGSKHPYAFAQVSSAHYDWHYITITHLREYTHRLSDLRALLAVFFIMMLIVSVCLALFFSMSAFKPIQDILNLLNNPDQWDSTQYKSEKEIKYIAQQIVSYMQKNNTLSQELQNRLHLLNETRIWALQSQINPHFLFNTLNLIHLSIAEELGYKHRASAITVYLGKLLRYALEPTSLVTIETELEYTRLFLTILNHRYDHQILTDLSVSSDTMHARVPKLILQPIIENSIYHGIEKSIHGDSKITIHGYRSTRTITTGLMDCILLKIEDNGMGMDADTLANLQKSLADETEPHGQHIGLKNVAMRLRLLYGDNVQIQIESRKEKGTCVTLAFPYIEC